ncbi:MULTISPECIES: mandelate racemase/muconate lactonizing enzyme family protein [unclassified Pseudonocardia]|uniref:mandelate racemase/muconate lactonizing enzyme family protein n=1 Tax=unclassified Pseudonocardia TaxID=2619320 RepID=UPI000959FE6A|nr:MULTISPECIES: mandelate racemase/muconate lactonizing enzyme family protein [unclassified Pseudonocardia]MBN9097601.1 mandelate racemase/muconate lactonizing enzyme family protein [Pseudonocardia sp.]OJY39915.1 MAG: isomerase [Pseudonocardia sp. 73-21]
MKITAIHLDRLRLPLDPPFAAAWDPEPRRHADATVVRVETDDGVVGVGSGDTMLGLAGHEHLFLGRDPLQIQRHVRTIESIHVHGGRCWPLEVALWDILGQVTGLPVATLFGGALDRIPAYASCGSLLPPRARVDSALALRAEGFRALKVRIDRHRADEGVATVAAVREAVGSDMEIMVDLNRSWRMAGDIEPAPDVAATQRLVERLGDLDVFWIEEPLPYPDRAGLAALRSRTGARIAGGEMLDSADAVLAHLDGDLLDVYQTDVVLALGMSRARTLGELALLRNRSFTPHTWTNGIGLLANLAVVAGIGGGPYLEFPYDPPGWTPQRRDFMLAEPVRIGPDGTVAVPTRPGIGAVLDPDAVERWRISPA